MSIFRIITTFAAIAASNLALADQFYLVTPYKVSQNDTTEISLSLSGATLPKARLGLEYSVSLTDYLTITGDELISTNAISWQLANGRLPSGLSLTDTGLIHGTPTELTNATEFSASVSYKKNRETGNYIIQVADQVLEAKQIAVGYSFSCALKLNGKVVCWGNLTSNYQTPTEIPTLSNIVKISAKHSSICAISSDKSLWCWGRAVLADSSTVTTPTRIDIENVIDVSVGDEVFCAITDSAELWCWGNNRYGEVGVGLTNAYLNTPRKVALSNVSAVSAGVDHTCAVSNSDVYCWGSNSLRQLGSAAANPSRSPVKVPGISNAQKVSAGQTVSCAIHSAGLLACWGRNGNYQTGTGSTIQDSPKNLNLTGVTTVNLGYSHACAIANQEAYCWGNNGNGQVGQSPAGASIATPRKVLVPAATLDISTGVTHTCVASTDGVFCWGLNESNAINSSSDLTFTSPTRPNF